MTCRCYTRIHRWRIVNWTGHNRCPQLPHVKMVKCQTPLHGHRLRIFCTTPPTDKLTTTCCTTNLPHHNARAQHLDMSRCWDVANFCPLVVNLLYTTSRRIVVSSSVGGVVQHVHSRCPCSGVWHLVLLYKFLCHVCTYFWPATRSLKTNSCWNQQNMPDLKFLASLKSYCCCCYCCCLVINVLDERLLLLARASLLTRSTPCPPKQTQFSPPPSPLPR